MATIYTESNLRLAQGNEKYRATIIAAASKYTLTPQSIAAMIGAEATSDPDGTWRADSNEDYPDRAQGLAQFFPDAWTDIFNSRTSLLCQDCKSMSREQWLSKRLEAKYAIDGIGAYASLNRRNFAATSHWDVDSLAPEDKAKIAYLLHHEGVVGTVKLLQGKPQPYTDDQAIDRLTAQLRSRLKAEQVKLQYGGDPIKAYEGWFFELVDQKINVQHYTVQDAQKFSVPPRPMANIVASLTGQTPPPRPQPRQEAASSAASDPGAPSAAGNGSVWFDPLEVCTIRTAHLKNKQSAEFGWTRNNRTKYHQGLDLAAEPGTPIRAVANGRIYMAKIPYAKYDYGNTLVLEVGLNDLPPEQAALFRKDNPDRKTIGFFMRT
ncbi:hypothetical protein VOM14_17005 [Paraburkholderia sp. MPAMCS5]|uniref:M23 family metallopeptidase n=1 Tax=Paraburkholderia sp. MPAMCS5 TaxID=3112563 RepID=UPI002E173580|nr:hypothetical protein [Paraburkholderia sp. MPAMCS5]